MLKNSPIEMPIGVAMISAMAEVTAVPTIISFAPKTLKFGFQAAWTRKPRPNFENAWWLPLSTW